MSEVSQFWDDARRELSGLPGGRGVNIAHEAVDQHVQNGNGQRIAIRWVGSGGNRRDISYQELSWQASRFANALKSLGVGAGDRIFSLLGRVPELHIAAIGTWKLRAVFCPLFSAFGPEPVKARMLIAKPVVVVTTSRHFTRKISMLSSLRRRRPSKLRPPILRSWPSSISPAARPDGQREPCMFMPLSLPIGRLPVMPWI
jgi:long-subunit acyl-CoA synthetase (AMP-forming)